MAKTRGKTANIFVWIILGLLVIGLAGFGVDGFGGSVRSVGKVGDRDIGTNDYFRALQQELRVMTAETGEPVSFAQARNMGVDAAVRGQLVTLAALENETLRLGLSVGDDIVSRELRRIPGFVNADGSFNREAYRFTLQNEGLSESQFEEQLRMDVARGILQTAVITNAAAAPAHVDVLLAYLAERHDFDHLRLTAADLDTPVPAPSDDQITAYHADNPEAFTLPEARAISYVWLTPAMLVDTVEVDEAALREAYDNRAAQFRRPERRLVERLVFPSDEAAGQALERIEAGEASFEDIVAERGLDLEDTDMGDVTRADLGGAGEAVFALDGPGIAGPAPSPFGPALFRVNAVLAASETPFDEALPSLRDELAMDRARRVIADQIDLFEDLLAGGAELEDLADETEMRFGTIELRPDTTTGIAGYEAFRRAATRVGARDFPEILVLDDGGVFALRLDDMVPPALRPLDEVRDEVIAAWTRQETERRLAELAEGLRAPLAQAADRRGIDAADDPAVSGLPRVPDRLTGLTRTDFLPDLPDDALDEAMALDPGQIAVVPAEGEVHLLHLLDRHAPDPDNPEIADLRAGIERQLNQSVARDLFQYYAERLTAEARVELNQAAIDAVHAQLR